MLVRRRTAPSFVIRDVLLPGLGHLVAVFADGHRAEFPDENFAAIQAIAPLAKQHGTAAGQPDRNGDGQHGQRQQHEQRPAHQKIERPLCQAIDAVERVFENADGG